MSNVYVYVCHKGALEVYTEGRPWSRQSQVERNKFIWIRISFSWDVITIGHLKLHDGSISAKMRGTFVWSVDGTLKKINNPFWMLFPLWNCLYWNWFVWLILFIVIVSFVNINESDGRWVWVDHRRTSGKHKNIDELLHYQLSYKCRPTF